MKKRPSSHFFNLAMVILTLLYTLGIFFIIAALSDFKLDGWFWLAILLFYAIFLPVYISGMVILIVLRKKIKADEGNERKKLGRLRLAAIICGIAGILFSPLALILSAFGVTIMEGTMLIVFSVFGAEAALILAIIDLIRRRKKAKQAKENR